MITRRKKTFLKEIGMMCYSELRKKARSLKLGEQEFVKILEERWYKTHPKEKKYTKVPLLFFENEARKVFHPTKEEKEHDKIVSGLYSGYDITTEDVQEYLDTIYPFKEVIRKQKKNDTKATRIPLSKESDKNIQ
nr:MAG TPA: hypothetical protein [Caudoviricetes sp.]